MPIPFSICYSYLQHYIKKKLGLVWLIESFSTLTAVEVIIIKFKAIIGSTNQFISLTCHPSLTSVSHDYLIYL